MTRGVLTLFQPGPGGPARDPDQRPFHLHAVHCRVLAVRRDCLQGKRKWHRIAGSNTGTGGLAGPNASLHLFRSILQHLISTFVTK